MDKLKGFPDARKARLHAQDSVPQTSPDIDYPDMYQLTALKPSSGKYSNTGGSGGFDITVSPQDCGWNVATTNDWIHVDTTTGTGNGTATFHLDANGTGKNIAGKINASLTQDSTKKKTFTVNESK